MKAKSIIGDVLKYIIYIITELVGFVILLFLVQLWMFIVLETEFFIVKFIMTGVVYITIFSPTIKYWANKIQTMQVTDEDQKVNRRINRLHDNGWRLVSNDWWTKGKYGIIKKKLYEFTDEQFEQVIINGNTQ